MKVLHINTFANGGGAAIAARRHCLAMRKVGIDAKMLALAGSENEYTIIYPRSVWESKWSDCLTKGSNLMGKLLSKRGIMSWLDPDYDLSIIKELQEADIIYIHWINGFIGVSGLNYLLSLKKPIIWFMHDMWPITGGCHHSFECSGYKADCDNCNNMKAGRSLCMNLLRKKRMVINGKSNIYPVAPSIWLTNCIKESSLFKYHNAFVIPNLIDSSLYSPRNKMEMRTKLNLPIDKKIILFTSVEYNNPYKGTQYLINVLKEIKSPDIEFAVVGKCAEKDLPDELISRTHLLGFVDSEEMLVSIYNAADVLLITSIAENFPNVVIEAMSCGLPVVGFATGGIVDQIKHKETGWIAKQKDVNGIIDGINWILNNERYSDIRKSAREYIENNYSYNKVLTIHKPLFDLISTNIQ